MRAVRVIIGCLLATVGLFCSKVYFDTPIEFGSQSISWLISAFFFAGSAALAFPVPSVAEGKFLRISAGCLLIVIAFAVAMTR